LDGGNLVCHLILWNIPLRGFGRS
jgi:hypothetical protein